jgi:hypothetical protein
MARSLTDTGAVSLRATLRPSRTLCRASTWFARTARRTWGPQTTSVAERPQRRPGLLARLFGRRG